MAPTLALAQTAAPVPAQTPAQTPAQAQAAPTTDAEQQGVLVFTPDFFADQRPNTALDMVNRLPGFNFDQGDSGTRGLAGTAGNVLIDGKRPSTKSDSLDEILDRIYEIEVPERERALAAAAELTEAQRAELERRLALYEREPARTIPWDEFRRELERDE
jgi:putative addiction module component (TIGR02574 family)